MSPQAFRRARFWIVCCIWATAVVLGALPVTSAETVAFMPGDAFFVFLLNERLLDALPKDGGTIDLSYHAVSAHFDGFYSGFKHLRIDGVTPQFVQHLRRAYRDHRTHFPKIIREDGIEMNPPIAFVYNRDADWSSQQIALKYNEDWHDPPAEAFEGRRDPLDHICAPATSYVPLIKSYDAVVEDWGGAKQYKPLSVKVPKDIAWGKSRGALIDDPVIISSAEVQIVVTTEEDLEVYFLQLPLPTGPMFYQVLPDELNECYWEDDDCCGKKFVKEALEKQEAYRIRKTRREPPTVYYGEVRENQKNGDITIPVWPHLRLPRGLPSGLYNLEE